MFGVTMLLLLLQAANPPAPPPPDLSTKAGVEAQAKAYFADRDTNKDGKVDRTEAEVYHKRAIAFSEALRREAGATFSQLDSNKDGMLSRDEYMAIAGTMPQAKEAWFDGNDQNKDGRVEVGEAVRRVQVIFEAMDSNKDGKLSSQEMAAARGAPAGKR